MEVDKLCNEEQDEIGGNENDEDYLVKTIGAFGAWQAKVCILAMLTRFLAMWNMLNIMFLTYDNKFICVKFNGTRLNVSASTCYDNCVEYEFEEGIFVKSFVSEFELICEKAWMSSFTQTILMFGLLFGVYLFGWLSDRFGRRKAIFSSAFLVVVLMVASSFAPDYWTFCSLRFFTGVATGGVLIVSIVIVLEVVGPQHREAAGCGINLPDGLAEASLVSFVQFSPTWRIYLLSMSGASALIMVFLVLLPESPRWLMATGRLDEAKALMMKAAKCNNLDLATTEENINSILPRESKEIKTTTYCDLFKTKKLFTRTLCSALVWMIAGMGYFGITQYCTFLGTNVFVSVVIMGLMQIPGAFIATWLNKVYGRKATIISNLSITGLTMFLLIFASPDHWAALTLGIVGLWAVTITFNILYVYVSELFPTPLRNMGYGVSSSGAKIGAMVAPFIANLSPHWIPSLIFSVLSFLGAGVCCALPETKGRALEDELGHVD
ncbi:organic cation transporter protein-like [Cydia amplana]|uniref:organic cation transporter protein-like n=1 Tax=Cydia amplana TaxID=1869771 RepID=UPI002FE64B59